MRLVIGNEVKEIEARITSDLLSALNLGEGKGIAIAINDAVVPRSRWEAHSLKEGDRVEIVRAVQGG
jgi:sulfur carrier protein